jgi:UDP-N-acetyl-D-galactosamine dehydrogenase
VHDPWVRASEAWHEYDIAPVAEPAQGAYDAVVVAVGHREFVAMGAEGIRAFGKPLSVVYDVKYVLPRDAVDGRL